MADHPARGEDDTDSFWPWESDEVSAAPPTQATGPPEPAAPDAPPVDPPVWATPSHPVPARDAAPADTTPAGTPASTPPSAGLTGYLPPVAAVSPLPSSPDPRSAGSTSARPGTDPPAGLTRPPRRPPPGAARPTVAPRARSITPAPPERRRRGSSPSRREPQRRATDVDTSRGRLADAGLLLLAVAVIVLAVLALQA